MSADLASVRQRDDNRCARCSSSRDLHVHHRIRRSQYGGNGSENLITLCAKDHMWVHANPYAARAEGLLLRATDDAFRFPVRHASWPFSPVLLGPDFDFVLWDEQANDLPAFPESVL